MNWSNFEVEEMITPVMDEENTTQDVLTTVNNTLNVADLTVAGNVDFWLAVVTVISLASLGILGNVFSIAVWKMETSFSATVFLFKYLAMWDIVFLVSVIVYAIVRRNLTTDHSALILGCYHTGNFVQLTSVHVTLLIAVSRWIAVIFPLKAQRLVTCRRIYLSCVFIFVYCGILEAAQGVFNAYYPGSSIAFVAKRVVGLAVPLLLLLVFNVSLLWTALRPPRGLRGTEMQDRQRVTLPRRTVWANRQGSTWTSQSSDTATLSTEEETLEPAIEEEADETKTNDRKDTPQKCCEPVQQQKHHQHNQQQQQQQQQQQKQQVKRREQRARKRRVLRGQVVSHSGQSRKGYMLKAVLLVSLCSFIAYPVGNSLQSYVIFHTELALLTRLIVINVALIFQVVNSGINVLIYWFFVSTFRTLTTRLWNRLRSCLRCGSARYNPRQRSMSYIP